MTTQTRKIAIIGVGPRGGYALERLIVELTNKRQLKSIHIALFEKTGYLGNGEVYNINQSASNWINITERILDLQARKPINCNALKIGGFPSYKKWANLDYTIIKDDAPDTYPPRLKIGKYLSERLHTLINPLIEAGIVTTHKELVTNINFKNGKSSITTNMLIYHDFDEVLLTIGHQPTLLSQQIENWQKFVIDKKHLHLFKSPYPTKAYTKKEIIENTNAIGIRGFGLAMIDVVRAIATQLGEFITLNEHTKSCIYTTNKNINSLFIPFSLNGLPPVPKPLSNNIDKQFKPTTQAIKVFEETISNKSLQKRAVSEEFLIDAFVPIASSVFVNLSNSNNTGIDKKELNKVIKSWLLNQKYTHPLIISNEQPILKIMQAFVNMAIGAKPISLDFCIGQVWRHCQPTIYKALSFNAFTESVFSKIIKLDESTKRYSYGPPVESIQQLIALTKTGVLNLDFVNNPEIELTKKGWRFTQKDISIVTNVMIDSVLDSPKIKHVNSAIVKALMSQKLIQPVHDDFGVATNENGYLVSKDVNQKIPLALLGRLAKGTIIGVDAILECFGERPKQWAIKASKNHINWLNNN